MADEQKKRDDDLWAQLLGAARSATEENTNTPEADPEPGDPWAQLLSAAQEHISGQEEERENRASEPGKRFAKGSMLLGTYRIESEPMHGGMGDVWRVRHTGWDMDLAMKRPQAKMFANESSKQGFIDECRNWINLGLHPNIVSCYYVREIDGVPTIFSEWMENGDLERHIQRGTLYDGEEEEVQKRLLDIAIQYARGLRYAHDAGLIHQDVKPANLLLTNDWQAKAADFGLANARTQLTVLEGDVTRQDPGQSLNAAAGGYTPAYCSMEQMDGKTLTRRTDIYSWAVSMMEMYYGRRPWANGVVAGGSCREYMAHPDCRVRIPDALRVLLAHCMELNADDRPHDFGVIEEELKRIWRGTFGGDYSRPEPEAAPDTADSLNNMALTYLDLGMPEKAEEYWDKALATKPDHLAATYNQGLYDWRAGRITYEEMLQICGNADSARDETGLASRWKELVETEYREDFGRSVILGDKEMSPYGPPCVVLSKDRKRVYCGFENVIGCWDTGTLEKIYYIREKRDPSERDYIHEFQVSRDGRYLAGVSADRTAWVAEAATGKILHYLCRDSNAYGGTNDRRNRIVGMCLHPDSRRAFVLWGYDRMQIFDLETGKEIRSYSVASPLVRGWKWTMCFSPDGGTLYLGTTAGAVCSLDAESGGYLSVTDTPSGTNIGCVKVSDSGERLWCCSTEGSFFLFRTDDMDEYEELTPPRPLWDPFWVSEDGSRILGIGDNSEPWLWDPDTGEEVRSFRSLGSSSSVDAADDLSMVVLGNDGKAIQFWDGRAEQKRAPWEVSRTKDWQEQQEQRKDTDRLKNEIESRIREKQIREAVLLLENAEKRYDPMVFLNQRRKLSRVCTPGKITETHVITRFEAKWGKFLTTHPWKDLFAVYAYTDCPTVFLYSEKGILLFTVPLPKETEIIYSLRFLPTGILAAGCKNCAVLIDPDRGEILRVLGDPKNDRFGGFGEPLFTPDGRMMLAAGKDRDGDETWELWNVENCRVLRTLEMPPEGWADWNHSAFRFLDGGKKLISSTRFCDGMLIYDLETGKVVQQLETYGRSARIMGITPDGSRLFVRYSPERPVSVIDMETREICGEIAGSGGVHMDELCISPDGTLMAAYYGKTLHIWTIPDIRLQCEIPDNAQDDAVKLAFFWDSSLLGIRMYDRIRVMAIRRELR